MRFRHERYLLFVRSLIVETAPLYCAMARRPAPTEYAGWFDRYIRLVEDVDDLAETMARQPRRDDGLVPRPVRRPGRVATRRTNGRSRKCSATWPTPSGACTAPSASPAATGLVPAVRAGRLREDVGTRGAHVEQPARRVQGRPPVVDPPVPAPGRGVLDRVGSVNQNPTTARAIGYVIVGHERHHLAILEDNAQVG